MHPLNTPTTVEGAPGATGGAVNYSSYSPDGADHHHDPAGQAEAVVTYVIVATVADENCESGNCVSRVYGPFDSREQARSALSGVEAASLGFETLHLVEMEPVAQERVRVAIRLPPPDQVYLTITTDPIP